MASEGTDTFLFFVGDEDEISDLPVSFEGLDAEELSDFSTTEAYLTIVHPFGHEVSRPVTMRTIDKVLRLQWTSEEKEINSDDEFRVLSASEVETAVDSVGALLGSPEKAAVEMCGAAKVNGTSRGDTEDVLQMLGCDPEEFPPAGTELSRAERLGQLFCALRSSLELAHENRMALAVYWVEEID